MRIKRFLAVAVSLCMAAGTISCGVPIFTQTITAQAANAKTNNVSYDEKLGVLLLRGKVDSESIKHYRYWSIKTVVALEGTVLPEDCSELFSDFNNCTNIDLSDEKKESAVYKRLSSDYNFPYFRFRQFPKNRYYTGYN